MPLTIEARQERLITVIRLSGQTVDGDAQRLGTALCRGLEETENRVIVELHALEALDQASATALDDGRVAAESQRGWLKLAGARSTLIASLALAGVETRFSQYDSVDAVLESVAGVDERGVKHFDILKFVQEQEKEE